MVAEGEAEVELNSKIPDGPIEDSGTATSSTPAWWAPNRPTYDVIVAPPRRSQRSLLPRGAGLQRARVHYHDTPRRAHSIAAQGGINACKNYREDGDSTYRLFYDTQKGGDFRSRRPTSAGSRRRVRWHAGQPSGCRRTFYCRGQTGQQLLLAYQALQKEIELGKVKMYTRSEMLDLVMVDGRPAVPCTATWWTGPSSRSPVRRWCWRPAGTASTSIPPTRSIPTEPSTAGRGLRQPLLRPDPPDLHPGLRGPPEQAHPDERIPPERRTGLGPEDPQGHPQSRRHPRGGTVLLPRGAVPDLREPGPPGRGLEGREGGLRRRTRGRLHRLLGVHGLPGRHRVHEGHHRREVREPGYVQRDQ